MKKINLRAWDNSNKIMHYDFQFISSGDEGNDWIIFTSDKQKLNSVPHPLENPYFRKQFKISIGIGMNDCNGKEYYTGDIVKTDTIIQYVDYNESNCCYGVRQFSGGATVSIDPKWEIIGNIFENETILHPI